MANTPITLDRFGGLDLGRDITELGLSAASFCENVDFEGSSLPRRRFGAKVFNAVAPAGQYTATAVAAGTPPVAVSTAATSAGTGTNVALAGSSVSWSNPGNITSNNGSYATAAVAGIGQYTDYLQASNFGFAIPADATIKGILVEVEKSASAGMQVYDAAAKIVKGGTIGGTSRAILSPFWPTTSNIYTTYGSSTDLWGETWTGSDINASDFGFVIAAFQSTATGDTVSVDHVRVTVYYDTAATEGEVYSVRASGADFVVDRLGIEEGELLTTSGAFAGDAGSGGQSCRFARLGTDAAGYVFITPGSGNDAALMRWNGSAFSNTGYTGTSPEGACVAVTPWDNRLVVGGGSDGTWDHQVIFSDEGDPLTFSADNTLLLHPGNSERIVEIVTWENFVFMFKQTEFFVFYGVSTDSAGGPVFEYRTVSGEGCSSSDGQKRHAAVGRDAVYFVNERGVWATRGGDPTLISQALDPLFVGGSTTNPYADIERRKPDGLWYSHGRLYLAFEGTTNLYVFDTREGWWTTYDLPGGEIYDVAEDRVTDEGRTLISLATPDIYELHNGITQDAGSDEVQSVIATGGTAGTFTLVFDDGSTTDTTGNINWDDTAADVQTALEALDNIAPGDVYCYGGPLPDSAVYIKFIGDLAETGFATMTVGTEAVTNGNAAVSAQRDGSGPVIIACTWISGASDLGYDADKVIKELLVTATDGTLRVSLSTETGDFPATPDTNDFTGTQTLRYRGAATNVKGRLIALKLENDNDSEAESLFNPQRVTLVMLGSRGGPQEGAE